MNADNKYPEVTTGSVAARENREAMQQKAAAEICDECGVNTLALLKERDVLKKLVNDLMYRADLFSYVCWLEEKNQREQVPNADFIFLASDGMTCWGKTFEEAVKVAMQHDKGLQDSADAGREGFNHG